MAELTKELSELVEVDPTRVDRVKSPANGFPFLIMKSTAKDVDKKGRVDETPDISNAEAVIRLLAGLMEAEARELGAGNWDEVCDIDMLVTAAHLMTCFRDREQMSAESASISKSLASAISGRANELGVTDPMTEPASKETGVTDDNTSTTPAPSTETPAAPIEKSVPELIAEAIAKEVAAREETIKGLRDELTELKNRPLPGGPKITAAAKSTAPVTDGAELARFKRLAKEVDDRELRAYYAERVKELEAGSK